MNVFEDMVGCDADVHAGKLGSPKEVPMLFDLELFVPANRLQDIAVGNETVADIITTCNLVVQRYAPEKIRITRSLERAFGGLLPCCSCQKVNQGLGIDRASPQVQQAGFAP